MRPHSLLCLTDQPRRVPFWDCGAAFAVELDVPAGLYNFSAIFDASAVDWERFYLPMNRFGNHGQRTGVWDFDFDGARPMLPAWWLFQNGRRRGIAMVQRVSPAEIEGKRLSMTFALEHGGGTLELRFEPYNEFELTWLDCRLEPEHQDDATPMQSPPRANYARQLAETGELELWARKLGGPAAHWRTLLNRAIATAKAKPGPEVLPLLAFAVRELNDREAEVVLLGAVRDLVTREHWGNPLPDGYGHNGDMGAAAVLEPLSFVLQWSRTSLEAADLAEILRSKLQLQMERFYDQILLWSAYWGGSLLQDHGHRSICRFATAAFNLLGEVEASEKWLGFAIRRMDRVLEMLPADGAIPASSHNKVHLYLDDLLHYRDALRHATGRDIFDRPLFARTLEFVANRLHEPSHSVLGVSPRGDRRDFYAGWGVFNALAAKNEDPKAARLAEILRHRYHCRELPERPIATILDAIQHESGLSSEPLAPAVLDVRESSGQISYRPIPEVTVCIRCQPPGASREAAAVLTNRCDLATDAPLEGHFTVSIGARTLLLTAEGGYRMDSSLGSVLHVDGQGPYGDIGYAMSVPGLPWRGERIEAHRFDEIERTAYVRLCLHPAYPAEMGMLRYVREFFLRPEGLVCRDTVCCTEPHEYSWHFQSYARRCIDPLGDNQFRVSDGGSALTLGACGLESPLAATVGDTDVVWAYGNENGDQPFRHIRFATTERTRNLTAEFHVSWGDL